MQREIQVICGNVSIPKLSGFLKTINSIASENDVIIQGLNADLIAGESTFILQWEKLFGQLLRAGT